MKKKAVTAILKRLLYRAGLSVHKALFRYQVRQGLILCAVEPGEDVVEIETSQDDQTGEETTGTAAGDEQGQGNEDVVVTIGEGSPPPEDETAPAPEWVRELRKNHRDLVKRNRELEEQLKASSAPAQKATVLGPKPTLKDPDIDYDEEKFSAALDAWHERKRKVDEEEARTKSEAKAAQDAWTAKVTAYGEAKAKLKVQDFDDAEATVQNTLSPTQQGVILQGAERPELVVYALGKNPQKLKELSAITDPVKYAFAVAKLETQLKVTNRKAPPPPEKTVQGSGSTSGAVDSNLDRLRAEAEKTGDYSKVIAYKNQQKLKAK
jgi:hypothetical protein